MSDVSALCLGAMVLGFLANERTSPLLDKIMWTLAAVIDTANIYGLGRWLSGR